MTPAKHLVGQNLIVFAIVIVGVWFATEWCSAELGFQPQLGSPWFVRLGLPVCRVWFWYNLYAPAILNRAGAIAASSGLAGCIVAIVGSLWRARENRLVTPTDPCAATGQEIDAAGCSAPQVSSSAGSAGSIRAMIARAAVWQRIIMANDASIPIDNLLATDAAGHAVPRTRSISTPGSC
jgi:hypothetical protein